MLLQEVFDEIDKRKDEMVKHRRHIHENAELSFEEEETAKYIADYYKDKDVEVTTNMGGNGLRVVIDTGKPGKTIALRADFDALPIKEETGLPFASKNDGVMHACGHDAHTAYLMLLADVLNNNKDKLKGKIVIIHQHAEETPPGGAKAMIEEGVLDGVDNVFGIHVMSSMPSGTVQYHKGNTQTGRSKFAIKFQGTGGHGSMPHLSNDSIVAASHFVTAVQTVVSRRLSPFENGVVTIGSFEGAGSFNIIKDSVTVVGDVRAMADETKEKIGKEIKRIANGIGETFGMEVEIDYTSDYPVLYNDPEMTQLVIDAITEAKIPEVTEISDCGPQPPSEDFAYYAKERPSCFYYVGAHSDKAPYPHHHPKFDINEDAMIVCAKSMAAVAIKYLGEE
ncbi:amidohydrolase [Peptoniphilus sp. MSJ-1]|uniref:Amidohydrolase n=1 Tax=Peptoniphilus ovalis TaxID=2841503 RepID=A0ABS6FEV5_9FIRM|nr:amidohydrolase [Peptoniphilus ovalis]MBU5668695.1 amidohydrolase [Peptoniphilus ovalis]